MTTSEPQADRRDDDGREHRTIGQRIRDAVLGDPAEGGDDPNTRRSEHAYAEEGVDRPEFGPAYADSDAGQGTYGGRETARLEADEAAGGATANREVADAPYTDPNRPEADAAYAEPSSSAVDRGDAGRETDRDSDREYGSYEQAMREHVQSGAVPDPVRDDVRQDGTPRESGVADRTESGDPGSTAAPGDRDLVTSSYDPDRDTGYDPHAAGTAMAGSGAAAGASAGTATGAASDTGVLDRDERTTATGDARDRDTRDYDTRDYDPATDTGYPDEGRTDVDRATGHRDADYDTGRVDTDREDSGGRRSAATGAVAAGSAAAAAGLVAPHGRPADDRADSRFNEVDDTTTVEPTSTGRATPDASSTGWDATPAVSPGASAAADTATERRAEAVADEADGSGRRERLVPAERADDYSARWDALKGDFVDEPRRAVAQADGLVGELLDEIQRLFADQRRELEQGFANDEASTEDLRLALRRYRSFFDRLLSF